MALKKVFFGKDAAEAHFVRGLLEAQGLHPVVLGEILGTARGDLPLSPQTLPSVYVLPEEVEAAMPIIQEYVERTYSQGEPGEEEPPSAGEPWKCPRCGEMIEAQFTQCWNCLAERPGFGQDEKPKSE